MGSSRSNGKAVNLPGIVVPEPRAVK
jgi:hypothetical protein